MSDIKSLEDIFNDDDLGLLDDGKDGDIFKIKHVPVQRAAADELLNVNVVRTLTSLSIYLKMFTESFEKGNVSSYPLMIRVINWLKVITMF